MSNKILLSIAVSVGIAVLFTLPAQAKVLVDSAGTIILQSGVVLGDNSGSGGDGDSGEDGDSSGSGSSDSDSSDTTSEEKQREEQRETAKQVAEKKREEAKQTAEEKREAAKQAVEVRREAEKQKLEIKIKENKARYLMKKDGQKIRIDARDGQTRVRIENKMEDGVESEDEVELENEIEDEQEIEIEPGAEAENTRLRVLRSKAIIERLRARAITSAPLTVDPETNTLSITTPRGDVKVVVLPDAAIQKLIENNIVDEIVSEPNDSETESATAGEEEKDTVRLESEDESPVYKIAGIKRLKFLGLVPFESKIDTTVSAETGEVLERKQERLKRFLSFFSTSAK